MSLNLPAELKAIFDRIDRRLDSLERRRLPELPDLSVKPVAAGPITIVAADGSGDFTSIKSAIDSFATNTTTNRISGVILVKPSLTVYSDVGAGTISITDKQVEIIGLGPTSTTGLLRDAALTTMPGWNNDGISGSGAARLSLYGLDIQQANLLRSAGIRVTAERCNFASLSNAAGITSAKLIDCYFSAAVFNATSGTYSGVWIKGCQLAAGWAPGSATFVAGGVWRIEGSLITGQVTTTLNSDNAGGGQQIEYLNNELNVGATATWTFGQSGTEDHLVFSGNTRFSTPSALLTLAFAGSGHGPQLVMSGNDLPYTDVSCTYTATDAAVSISGLYRSIGLAQTGANVNAVLDGRGSSTITLLVLSSGAVGGVYNVSLIPGTTTKGYALAAGANNNILNAGNATGCTTASTNAGTGNLVQAT